MNDIRTYLIEPDRHFDLLATDIKAMAFTNVNAGDTNRVTLQTAIDDAITALNNAGSNTKFMAIIKSYNGNRLYIRDGVKQYSAGLSKIRDVGFTAISNQNELTYCKISNDLFEKNTNYMLSLGFLKNTIFDLDKDIFFGDNNKMSIIIEWSRPDLVYFVSDGTDYAGNLDITNITLNLCIEKHPVLIRDIKNKVSEGMTLPITHSHWSTGFYASETFTHNLYIDGSKGQYIHKFYIACYDPRVSNNLNKRSDLIEYNIKINNVRTNDNNYVVANYDDYLEMLPKLKNSCILSKDEYYHNHCFIMDLTELGDQIANNTIDGYNIKTSTMHFQFNATASDKNNYVYVYYVTKRLLNITNTSIILN